MANRVCVIYKDVNGVNNLKGVSVAWDNINVLAGEFVGATQEVVVRVVVQHVQQGFTNEIGFNGNEIYYLKLTPAGLRVRSYDTANQGPEQAQDFAFKLTGDQDIAIDLPARILGQAGGAQDVQLLAYSWQEADYDQLDLDAANFDLSTCTDLDPA